MSSETQTPAPTRRLLTYQEAAAVYGVTQNFVLGIPWAELPRVVLSARKRLFHVDDLEAYFHPKEILAPDDGPDEDAIEGRMERAVAFGLSEISEVRAQSLAYQRNSDGCSWLYAILREDSREVKIGISGNPFTRLLQIQEYHGSPLRLTLARVGGLPEERQIHDRFARFRRMGEWFTLSKTIETWIAHQRVEARSAAADGVVDEPPFREAERRMMALIGRGDV